MSLRERYVRFLVSKRNVMLPVVIVLTLFFLWQAFQIKMKTNFFELYPPRHPFIKVYREFRKLFGTANVILVVLESKGKDIYTADFIRKVDEVTRFLMETKGVNPLQILSITHPSVRGFRVKGFWVEAVPIVPYLPSSNKDVIAIKERIERNPGIKGFLVSDDDKSAMVIVGLWEEELDFDYLRERMNELKMLVGNNINIYTTGYPLLYSWIHSYVPSIYRVFFLTVLSLVVLLFFYFGDLKGIVVPTLAGIVSGIWAIGLTKIIGFDLDPLLLVVPVLLSARALSHSVQVMERYYELYSESGEKLESIIKAFAELYRPALLSILTDGLGILTIAVSGIPLMWKLALYSSFWIGSIFIGVLTLSPLLLSLFPSPEGNSKRPSDVIYEKLAHLHFTLVKTSKKRFVITACLFATIVITGFLGRNLKVGNVMPGHAILKKNHPYNIAMDMVNKNFYGANQFVVIADSERPGGIKEIKALLEIEEFEKYLLRETSATTSISLPSIVKRIMRLFHENDPNWEVLPYKPTDVGAITYTLGRGREMQRFFDDSYRSSPITFFYKEFSNEMLKDIVKKVKKYSENKDGSIKLKLAGGLLGILYAVNDEVERSYWLILFVVLTTICFLVIIFFRSWRIALILIPSLLLAQFVSEVFMSLVGIDMNINSLPVAAVGIGVGIDYGIYILSRIRDEISKGKSYLKAVENALRGTGKAIFFTASTMVFGVIFWMVSPLKFSAEMALLLALLMVLNMEGALIFVPVLTGILLINHKINTDK